MNYFNQHPILFILGVGFCVFVILMVYALRITEDDRKEAKEIEKEISQQDYETSEAYYKRQREKDQETQAETDNPPNISSSVNRLRKS